jgi:hypothetical protein
MDRQQHRSAAHTERFASPVVACYNGDSTESPGFPTSVKLMAMPKPLANYTSYRGLPPLAGLCSIEEAARPGLSVEECVRRLKRFHYAFKRLHEILVARLRPGAVFETDSIRPTGVQTTWFLIVCRFFFPE